MNLVDSAFKFDNKSTNGNNHPTTRRHLGKLDLPQHTTVHVITNKQILQARRVSGVSQEQLAAEAFVPMKTLQRIEVGIERLRPEIAATLKVALEKRGVLFRRDGTVEMKPGFLQDSRNW